MYVDMFIIILFILFILEYKYSINYIKVIIKRGSFYYDDFLFFRIYLVLFIVLDIFFFKFLVFKFI